MAANSWVFRTVTPQNWDDFTALFQARGGPRPCWCMLWRLDVQGKTAPRAGADRSAAMQALVQADMPIGVLGYDQDLPVAWCSIAPRARFGASLAPETKGNIWSLTCFFIRPAYRKQQGFVALLAAAEATALANGANKIEAYPVAPDSPSYRFCGFVPNFESAGYRHIDTAGTRRHVMRKTL
jgi:GNAT superfamily N-acetyltransferase